MSADRAQDDILEQGEHVMIPMCALLGPWDLQSQFIELEAVLYLIVPDRKTPGAEAFYVPVDRDSSIFAVCMYMYHTVGTEFEAHGVKLEESYFKSDQFLWSFTSLGEAVFICSKYQVSTDACLNPLRAQMHF